MTCNVEYLLPVIRQSACFVYIMQIIVILSIIVLVGASVKSTNVIHTDNGTYLCDFLKRFCGHSIFVLQTIDIHLTTLISARVKKHLKHLTYFRYSALQLQMSTK